ncbi:MAG: hypothetical protein L6R35_007358, partial [Caloplaca aegaea]
LDPEGSHDGDSNVDDSGDDTIAAKEHYIDVGKSRLRKSNGLDLGLEYSGSHISRDNLEQPADSSDDDPFASAQSRHGSSNDSSSSGEYADPDNVDVDMNKNADQDDEIDSAEAFGADDADKFQSFVFRGSSGTRKDGIEIAEVNGNSLPDHTMGDGDNVGFSDMDSDEMGVSKAADESTDADTSDIAMRDQDSLPSEDEGSTSKASSSDTENDTSPPPTSNDRAALRKMMAESQKTITSNLSKATKSDIAKGRAIKHQRTTFDALLNTRIRLQKALIVTNALQLPSTSSIQPPDPAIQAAEQAALNLWSTLDTLRQSLHPASPPSNLPFLPRATTTTPLSTLWSRMQSHEARSRSHRTSTLNKWSAKTAPPSSLPRANAFSAQKQQPQQNPTPLSEILDQKLLSPTSMEKLIAKSQPAPDSSSSSTPPPQQIYDDTPFYSLLLRDLLSSRTTTSSSLPSSSILPTATGIIPSTRIRKKKPVDTKASKGRKMRYTVHEKLQNFMAPEDRGS